jgi:DNA-binding GntR family transcriptional regulator
MADARTFTIDGSGMERRKLSEQAFDLIKKMILSRQIKPGERIPEEKVSASLGISRTPVREALQKLQQSGLVHIVPRSYASVAELNPDDRTHIGEVRLELDALVARKLAETATEEDIKRFRAIEQACVEFAEKNDTAGVFEAHSELHLEMARRTGNPYLYEMMKSIDLKVQFLRASGYMSSEEIFENLSYHDAIINALANHDGKKAQELMIRHIKEFYFNHES